MSKFLLIVIMAGASYWPLPFDNGITGTFCEYRFQHIHAGFDFSTKGQTGFPVKCFEDGFILQIKVKKRGYGKVIYIKHPKKNIVSVYGHLENFSPVLEKIVDTYKKTRKTQYPGTIFLANKKIKLKKGEIIGYSGETGVGFPHLHFELRNNDNKPLNPVNYGLKMPEDKLVPIIEQLNVFPVDCNSSVNGNCNKLKIKPTKIKNGTYQFQQLNLSGKIAFSLKCYDLAKKGGKLGIKKIEFFVNNKLMYKFAPDSFSYNNYKESILIFDYSKTSLTPTFYTYNLFKIKGGNFAGQYGNNTFKIFTEENNNISIKVTDFNNNTSCLTGKVQYIEKNKVIKNCLNYLPFYSIRLTNNKIIKAIDIKYGKLLPLANNKQLFYLSQTNNKLKIGNCQIKINGFNSEKMLIMAEQTQNFPKWELPVIENSLIKLSPDNMFIKKIVLKYKFTKYIDKAGIYRYDKFKKKWIFIKSQQKNNYIIGNSYRPAIYGVFVDNNKPTIKGNLFHFKNKIVLQMKDLGMGIDESTIYLKKDNKKFQMEYDPDRKWAFTYYNLQKGKYTISVKDLACNTTTKKIILN